MKKPPLLLLSLFLASCASEPSAIPGPQAYRDEQSELQQQGEERLKAEFAKTYARYRCNESDVPASEQSTGPGAKFRSMQFGDHLVLKLKLGKLIYVNGDQNGGPMRTESRYELYWDGKLVSTAESLFSRQDVYSEESLAADFTYDAATQSLLIFEEIAWTTKRYIAFEPVGDPVTSKWTAKHVQLPYRQRFQAAVVQEGRFRGFGHGKIYREIDGVLYAFPVDDFLLETLQFTVG